MRRIALHEYLNQIEGLLDDNRLPEAAAHCHFVLQQYPRHIGTYRLFGRALLEQQLYDEAMDVFERLLSADPEDLISHAGLALAYSESRDLERSIWHMERAFDIDPYNRAVQDELRKLYTARDGDAPARLTLTRSALARLHLRAAQYRRATRELARLVTENPERSDLQLALAETCYLDLRLDRAADMCQKVLVTLPFCIKANAILVDVWLREERVDEAREHLRRVQSLTMFDRTHLDPDTTLGRALGNSRISLPETVQVEVLEDPLTFSREASGDTAWPGQPAAVMVDGEDVPDWLYEIGDPDTQTIQDDVVDAGTDIESEQLELADWLDEAAAIDSVVSQDELQDDTDELAEMVFGDDTTDLPQSDTDSQELLTIVDELGAANHSDAQLLVDRGAEGPEGEFDTPVEIDESEQRQDIPAAVKLDSVATASKEGPLLGLDDLRTQIDSIDDDDPSTAEAGAPDWLDELSESSEDMVELPSWLNEAVGFESTDPVTDDSSDSKLSESATGVINKRVESPGDETFVSDTPGKLDPRTDQGEGDISFLESILPDVDDGSDVPDWLLEGEDVLEELPSDLLDPDTLIGEREEDIEGDTVTWLDELTAQLLGKDDSSAGPDGEPAVASDDEYDDGSAGASHQ